LQFELTPVEFFLLIVATIGSVVFVFFLGWLASSVTEEAEDLEPSERVQTRRRRNTASLEQVDPPNRDQLNKLREILGIASGSLQFKKRGLGVYRVEYQNGKYLWTHIGCWSELKQRLEVTVTP